MTSFRPSRPWPLLGALAGAFIIVVDAVFFFVLGVEANLAGRNAFPLMMAVFGSGFIALGWALGALAVRRERARHDAATIAAQLGALEEHQRRLVQAEKLAAIGRLAASVAHEVRNPLGVIKSSAGLAEEAIPADDPDARRALSFVVEECDRLDAMITGLLAFARPAALQVASVDMDSLLDRAAHLAADEAERRGLRFERLPSEPAQLRGDPDLLCQVIFGLVVNAADAVGESGHIALRALPGRSKLVVEVADDGPGVPLDARAHLFEPFFSTKSEGTGLGLATAARVVQAHGGALELVDGAGLGPLGAGACFRLTLPVGGPGDVAA